MKITILKGDGVGPEIMDSALKVLDTVERKFNLSIEKNEGFIGGQAIDRFGSPLPSETLDIIDNSDAILLGAVGGPKWDYMPGDLRPERGLLNLRKYLDAYCNIRPIKGFKALMSMAPVKLDVPVDLCMVRELTGGIYFGKKGHTNDTAYDEMAYSRTEITRITNKAFEVCYKRSKKLTSIDKSNVLSSSRLWRATVEELNEKHKFELSHMYVDNAAMQLILNPHQFDVVLTPNMFGDILSDEASVLAGSIGVLPSASFGDGIGLYEPIHGSAPDIAGQDIANPIGMILSLAMLFKYSFSRDDIHDFIYKSVDDILEQGYGTKDLSKQPRILLNSEWTKRLIMHMEKEAV